ncbi:MAG TPA: hypothetical protein VE465_28700 [Streptosporangiaceae bacterium]|nr:hypothetical protein [Streptosporangiaceae bacterium]
MLLLFMPAAAQAQSVSHTCDTATSHDACERWYTASSVTLQWSWSANSTSFTGCQNETFFGEGLANRSCTVWWGTDRSATNHVWVGIDRTPPRVVSLQPDRPPDYNGWFNHPVGLTFQGEDGVSKIATCSSTVFGGPEGLGVTVSGTCTDHAGHTTGAAFPINYDATPPAAPSVHAMPGDGKVALTWSATSDSQAEVLRTSPEEGAAVVYRGPGGAFTDGSLRNERRYRYVVTLIDQAGNRASGDTSAVPTASRLLLPSQGARLGRRAESLPLLVWKAVRRARYYNVQLFRQRDKILSAWPKQPQLQLKRAWRYRGKLYHLLPARYCWRVWPGFGKRSAHRYGKQLGRKCFRVTR